MTETETPDLRAELAPRFPVGADLTITSPWPLRGTITEHGENGITIARQDGMPSFVAWRALHSASVVVRVSS